MVQSLSKHSVILFILVRKGILVVHCTKPLAQLYWWCKLLMFSFITTDYIKLMHNWSLFLLYMFITKNVERFWLTLILRNFQLRFVKQFLFWVHLIQIHLCRKHKLKFVSFLTHVWSHKIVCITTYTPHQYSESLINFFLCYEYLTKQNGMYFMSVMWMHLWEFLCAMWWNWVLALIVFL